MTQRDVSCEIKTIAIIDDLPISNLIVIIWHSSQNKTKKLYGWSRPSVCDHVSAAKPFGNFLKFRHRRFYVTVAGIFRVQAP